MRIAIVGSGVAGLSCAHVLGPHHDVVLFEADERLGGHANTVTVEDPTAGPLDIDTGFIVHNDRNYPLLTKLFNELAVPVQDSEMSFAVTDRSDPKDSRAFTYRATNLNTLFADRSNLVRPEIWRMLVDISRFNRAARRLLARSEPADDKPNEAGVLSLKEFLDSAGYSAVFTDGYLIPMGASVWSADPTTFDAFPAVTLFRFLNNHGLLSVGDRPQWRTIVGGSKVYVDSLAARFGGTIRTGTPVYGLSRNDEGVTVRTADGVERFDRAVLACHADQALDLLDDPTTNEKDVLDAIKFQPNVATLHTDTSLLSPNRRAWAAWNYECPPSAGQAGATLTYDMTTLQRLSGSRRYLVSLNSDDRIAPELAIASFNYSHPVFDAGAIAAQQRFEEIDGQIKTHFCGAYWGYGFHEDGISSAIRVCSRLGVKW